MFLSAETKEKKKKNKNNNSDANWDWEMYEGFQEVPTRGLSFKNNLFT